METAPADTAAVPTGPWGETDAQMVADEMVRGMLQGEWLLRWTKAHGGLPTLIVGPIRNRTSHYIDEESVIQPVSRKLQNADSVQVVLEPGEEVQQALRREREVQCYNPGPPSGLEVMRERGVDFLVSGTIRSTTEEEMEREREIVVYTVYLELYNVEENRKAWIAKKEVKKIIDQEAVASPRSSEEGNPATRRMSQGC